MITIKGVYENGKIKLLEKAPSNTSQKVLVTFIEEDIEESYLRNLSLTQMNEAMEEYLKDEHEDLYQDYAKNKK